MANFLRVARKAYIRFMADEDTGFNSVMASIQDQYGVPPVIIQWESPSTTFCEGWIEDPENSPLTALAAPGSPTGTVVAALYTKDAEDTPEPFNLSYSGPVNICLDIWVRFRTGQESGDSESIMDAIADAVQTVLSSARPWPPEARFNRRTRITMNPILPLSDGFQRKISFESNFTVTVN